MTGKIDVDNIDVGMVFVSVGGTAMTYVAGYQRAIAEQPMVDSPEGVGTVSMFGVAALSIGMLILAMELKLQQSETAAVSEKH